MKWLLPWWVRKVFKFCIRDHCSSSLKGEGEKILSSLFILFVCFHIKKKFFSPHGWQSEKLHIQECIDLVFTD